MTNLKLGVNKKALFDHGVIVNLLKINTMTETPTIN